MLRNNEMMVIITSLFVLAVSRAELLRSEMRTIVYENPSTWPCTNKHCKGANQSPINIDREAIVVNPALEPITFENYDKPIHNLSIVNSGYGVSIEIPDHSPVGISGGGLKDKYKLIKIFIPWSKKPGKGSLHTVDSKYFTSEFALIHLNTKYSTIVNRPDASVIISTFVMARESDNEKLNPLINALTKIVNLDEPSILPTPLRARDFLPRDIDHYVRYKGSEVMPPCFEAYTWILLHRAVSIGEKQLKVLQGLKRHGIEERGSETIENFIRPVQPLNDRIIESTPYQDTYYH